MSQLTVNVALLNKVKEHILAEPRRIRMEIGAKSVDESIVPCGTVGCIAGWAVILSGGISKKELSEMTCDVGEFPWGEIRHKAIELIGHPDCWELFYFENWPDDLVKKYRVAVTQQDVANVTAEAIDRFIAKYAS